MIRKAFLAGVAGIGLAVSVAAGAAESSDTYKQLNLFGDVFERIRADYVDEVNDKELIEAAIRGMLTSLDPHSSYLDAETFRDMQVQTRGEFGGLGIEVSMENGVVKVISPIEDTPASRAGVKPGDFITHLDGEAVLGLTLQDAVKKMRGPVNTDITITVTRVGVEKPIDITLKRGIIPIRSVRSRIEGNVGYVRISQFNEQTESGLKSAVDDIRAKVGDKLEGYILDLRENPGGLLDQAVAVSDAFLERGEVVSTRGRRNQDSKRYNARKGDIADGKPVIVLINGGSASASEIVAGALQDHRRAIILGTKSFGKGSVQTIMPLGSYGALRLTTSRYYTPSGRSIQAKGIDPDIDVPQAKLEVTEGQTRRSESTLRGHLLGDGETPNARPVQPPAQPPAAAPAPTPGASAAPEAGAPRADGTPPQDYQLARALDLMHAIALYGQRAVTSAN